MVKGDKHISCFHFQFVKHCGEPVPVQVHHCHQEAVLVTATLSEPHDPVAISRDFGKENIPRVLFG